MKYIKHLISIIVMIILICYTGGCNKNDDDNNLDCQGIDCLPPATKTGANTFGCLLDGEPFLPGAGSNPLDCVYQFVDGGYYFALQANKRDVNNNLYGVSIITSNLEIEQGMSYQLDEFADENASGGFFSNLNWHYTDLQNQGSLIISKLDFNNNIVSGTFSFDVKDGNGVVHSIRDGRFDMRFTQ